MNDDLLRRLRQADPALVPISERPASPSVRDLMETAMQSTSTMTTDTKPRRPRWQPALAAAAAVALLGVAATVLLGDDDQPAGPPAAGPAMTLDLPASDVMGSCIQYSVDYLAPMPTAFSGQVTEVGDSTVTLEVDRWYRGGDAGVVRLIDNNEGTASIDGVDFVEGARYLVTASEDGSVNACGFTARWTPQMAADFESAFAD